MRRQEAILTIQSLSLKAQEVGGKAGREGKREGGKERERKRGRKYKDPNLVCCPYQVTEREGANRQLLF